jgi:hypothetical protein
MADCFHRECDTSSSLPQSEASYDFLSRTTQALVLAIAELTMTSGQKCDYYNADKHVSNAFHSNPRLLVTNQIVRACMPWIQASQYDTTPVSKRQCQSALEMVHFFSEY